MINVADFHFIRPLLLMTLLPVAWLWWLWQRQSDPLRGWRTQIDPDLLRALTVGRGSRSGDIAVLLAATVAVVSAAGPTWRLEPSPFADDAAPLVILLQTDDTERDAASHAAHLARARLEIADIAAARGGQPLGLIAWAGSAHIVLPPTRDTAIVAQMAAALDASVMPRRGNRLDAALALGAGLLAGAEGSLLVICDTLPDLSGLSGAQTLPPVQFLVPDADEASVRTAARRLGATIEAFSADSKDTAAVLRRASRTALAQRGESARWEESGYWLVPLVALLLLGAFRRVEIVAGEAGT